MDTTGKTYSLAFCAVFCFEVGLEGDYCNICETHSSKLCEKKRVQQ